MKIKKSGQLKASNGKVISIWNCDVLEKVLDDLTRKPSQSNHNGEVRSKEIVLMAGAVRERLVHVVRKRLEYAYNVLREDKEKTGGK